VDVVIREVVVEEDQEPKGCKLRYGGLVILPPENGPGVNVRKTGDGCLAQPCPQAETVVAPGLRDCHRPLRRDLRQHAAFHVSM
jgi:hypothetical protein